MPRWNSWLAANGQPGHAVCHETSRFVREQGRWYYVDGDLHESPR